MRFITPLILSLLICAGCQTTPSTDSATDEWRRQLQTVILIDGISEGEAEIIAECYFAKHVKVGAFTGIRDGNNYWIVDGTIGADARPVQGFYINKHSGQVSSPIGPGYNNPLDIFP